MAKAVMAVAILFMAMVLIGCGSLPQAASTPTSVPASATAVLPAAQDAADLPPAVDTSLPQPIKTGVSEPEVLPDAEATTLAMSFTPEPTSTPRIEPTGTPSPVDLAVLRLRDEYARERGVSVEQVRLSQRQVIYGLDRNSACRMAESQTPIVTEGVMIVVLNGAGRQRSYFMTWDEGKIVECQIDQSLSEGIAKAKANLARRILVGADQIGLVVAVKGSWPDTSIGCPPPGSGAGQMISTGYFVVLEHSSQHYNYHGGIPSNSSAEKPVPRLCKDGEAAPYADPSTGAVWPYVADSAVVSATAMLATELKITAAQVRVLSVNETWLDKAAVGCFQSDYMDWSRLQGYVIRLEATSKAYQYVATTGGRTVRCENAVDELAVMASAAKADLAQRRSFAAEAIRLVSAEATVWYADKEGCAYNMGRELVSGYIVVLEHDSLLYEYRALGGETASTNPLLCVDGQPATPIP